MRPLGLLFLVILASYAEGFLSRGTFLEKYGDIFGIYCKEFDPNTKIWHHREIVREGVRRQLYEYFQVFTDRNLYSRSYFK